MPLTFSQKASHDGLSAVKRYVSAIGCSESEHSRFDEIPGQTTDHGSSVVVVRLTVLVTEVVLVAVDVFVMLVVVVLGRGQKSSLLYTIHLVDVIGG